LVNWDAEIKKPPKKVAFLNQIITGALVNIPK